MVAMNRPILGLVLLVLGSVMVDPIYSDSELDGILEKTRHEWRDDELSIKALTIGVAWVILGNVRNKPLITDLGSALVVFGLVLTAIGVARFIHGTASPGRPDTDRKR